MTQQSKTSAEIMIRATTRLVLTITILMGVAIVVATGHQLFEQTAITANNLSRSLQKVTIDSDHDWRTWRDNNPDNTGATYFVAVHDMRTHRDASHYFTPGAKRIRSQRVKLTKHLYYSPGIGLLFRQVGQARGIRYIVWQKMNQQVNVLLRIVIVTSLVAVAGSLFSIWAVRRLAKRLTTPLMQLSNSSEHLRQVAPSVKQQLPVPTEPLEVHQLATSFNQLLAERYANQQQQRLFIMDATHELKTPIASVYSNAQLINRHGRDHPEIIPRSINYIMDESRHMRQLVNQMLTLYHADEGLHLVKVDLSRVITQTIKRLKPTIKQSLQVTITPDCYSFTTPEAISQIVTNLVENAGKYTPDDTTINVKLVKQGHKNILKVTDNGPGIDPQIKGHLFDRFYRSDNVRGNIAGSGLGLAIVKQLVTASNGEVTVSDREPQGAVFKVTLPAVNE